MNSTSLLPLAQLKKLNNYPKMSFSRTMQLYIRAGGDIQQVEACSAHDFEAFIRQALSVYGRSKRASQGRLAACKTELENLDYDEIGKWFCLDTCKLYRIPIPVFTTYEDACASGYQQVLS